MKKLLLDTAWAFMEDYRERHGLPPLWRRPLMGFADADGPEIRRLRTVVTESHWMPEDFLERPRIVVSYFLPFRPEVGASNVPGVPASDLWAEAYLETNRMAVALNGALCGVVREMGFRAGDPGNVVRIAPDVLCSRWSQRHIAYAAGLGTFGLNNLLISDLGCCGRYFSIVTDLPAAPDRPAAAERCLYKAAGKCGLCVRRCINGALTPERFDRGRCRDAGNDNASRIPGAHVCGKCTVGVPCAFRDPTAAPRPGKTPLGPGTDPP